MSEETVQTAASGEENQPAGDSQMFTQDQVNVMVGNARKKERAKFENYERYKADSERLAEIEEANKSDLEKALSRAEQAETELAAIRLAQQVAEWKGDIAKETGVPVEALHGSTREELEACAEGLRKYFPSADSSKPYVASDGFAPTDRRGRTSREQFADALQDF